LGRHDVVGVGGGGVVVGNGERSGGGLEGIGIVYFLILVISGQDFLSLVDLVGVLLLMAISLIHVLVMVWVADFLIVISVLFLVEAPEIFVVSFPMKFKIVWIMMFFQGWHRLGSRLDNGLGLEVTSFLLIVGGLAEKIANSGVSSDSVFCKFVGGKK
jgi:hypothetical protein